MGIPALLPRLLLSAMVIVLRLEHHRAVAR